MKRSHCEICKADIEDNIVYPNITILSDDVKIKFKIAVDRIENRVNMSGLPDDFKYMPVLRDFDEDPCEFCSDCWGRFLGIFKKLNYKWDITK